MLAFFATPLGRGVISGLALTAILGAAGGGLYWKGRTDGRQAQLADTVAAYEKREGIDHAVGGMDRVRLCVDLGGLPEQCEQLRGVEAR